MPYVQPSAHDLRAALPRYRLGLKVLYRDHSKRLQTGTVLQVEAVWGQFGSRDVEPRISMTVSHPTYRNKRMYLGEKDIICEAVEEADQ